LLLTPHASASLCRQIRQYGITYAGDWRLLRKDKIRGFVYEVETRRVSEVASGPCCPRPGSLAWPRIS
jgi:hypothetical protein